MRFAVNAPPFADPVALVDLGVSAERGRLGHVSVGDHMVLDRTGVPIVDPWVILGAVAARTDRIRVGTCVTPLARRRPHKVARETATLDRLSRGRLVLGVGLGHPAEEYTTFGENGDPHVLAARTDEALRVLTGLWSGEPFTTTATHSTFNASDSCLPRYSAPARPCGSRGLPISSATRTRGGDGRGRAHKGQAARYRVPHP